MTAIFAKLKSCVAAVKTAAQSCLTRLKPNNPAKNAQQFRRHLGYLSDDLFNCFLVMDYTESLYLYERRVHKETINSLYWLSRLERSQDIEAEAGWLTLLLDAGQLRRRVSDHTVFGVCADEMRDIQQALSNMLLCIGEQASIEPLAHLANCINRLEDSFEHVIKVATREPLAFILFIGALRSLCVAAAKYHDE